MANINNVRGEKFIFTLKNATGTDKVVALLAAGFDTLKLTEGTPNVASFTNAAEIVKAGYTCDFVVDDGVIDATGSDLVCTPANSKMTYRAFRQYINQNSRVLKGMSIQTNNLAAFNQTLEIVNVSPLTGSTPTYIPLVALRDGMSNLNDVVNLDGEGLTLGFDTLMLVPILEGHQLTITFWF
ncbi:MAG: hypothetical protein WCI49_15450 [Ferruginibacter sp.]